MITKTRYDAAMARVRERGATGCCPCAGDSGNWVVPYWNATDRFSAAPEDTLMCRTHNQAGREAVLVPIFSTWEEFVIQLAHDR